MSATTPEAPDFEPHLTRWTADPGNASWLKGMLSTTRGKLLMDALAEIAIPKEDVETIASMQGDVQAKMAFRHLIGSGVTLCLQKIRLLSHYTPPVAELHGGWEGDRDELPA